jgi:hypothetical protein
MKLRPRIATALFVFIFGLAGSTVPARAGVHLWRVKEVFSNASGTIQFIELATCCGSTTEVATNGATVRSNSRTFTIPGNQAGSTLNKHLLLATSGFAALPGAPVPNYTIVDNFFSTTGDAISFATYDTLSFTAGMLPTNGTTSLNKDPNDATDTVFMAPNSPTNYADQTGSVSAGGPPAVPDGRSGTTPVTVVPTAPDGSSLQVSYDLASCNNGANRHIL